MAFDDKKLRLANNRDVTLEITVPAVYVSMLNLKEGDVMHWQPTFEHGENVLRLSKIQKNGHSV